MKSCCEKIDKLLVVSTESRKLLEVQFNPDKAEILISTKDGTESLDIDYCPYCGRKLTKK